MTQNASRATPEASRKGRETVCFVLCTCGVKTWHLVAKITTHDNSRQPSWLFEIPVSVTVSRASWTASTNRLLARSCFSIDLFAPKPIFTVCAWVHIQLQTTYARLLKYAWADAQTHMHARTHTCTARSSSRISHTLEDRCFQACWKTRRRRTFIL